LSTLFQRDSHSGAEWRPALPSGKPAATASQQTVASSALASTAARSASSSLTVHRFGFVSIRFLLGAGCDGSSGRFTGRGVPVAAFGFMGKKHFAQGLARAYDLKADFSWLASPKTECKTRRS
jgi:hypothetical protein